MKKLIQTATLGMFLSFPVVTHADLNVFSVETPIVKREVGNNVTGGPHISSDHSLVNTLVPQKLNKSKHSENNFVSNESFYVFGVDIKSLNLI